jgi:hypothetical protein
MADATPDVKHFAVLDENYKVVDYVVAASADIAKEIKDGAIVAEHPELEAPAFGSTYHLRAGKFIMPQPYPSWTLNAVTWEWEAPIPHPEGGRDMAGETSKDAYEWFEATAEEPAGWRLIPAPVAPADAPESPGPDYRWIPELRQWIDSKVQQTATDDPLNPHTGPTYPSVGLYPIDNVAEGAAPADPVGPVVTQ